MTIAGPSTIESLVEAVAQSAPAPLAIAGGGTSRPRPADAAHHPCAVLDTRAVAGITAYDPAECVVTVLAGTPVQHLADALAAHGQYLPWDPPIAGADATVGGMIATGVSGPGRHRYGGVRDFVIGARVVDGRGRLVASGGQVVKNAAGFLLHHALVGSGGRLGVIADVSLKVFPRPEATRTIVVRGDSLAAALEAHERLRLANLDLDALDLDGPSATVSARLAGAADALDARAARTIAAAGHAVETHTGDAEAQHWHTHSIAWWPREGATVKVPVTPSRLASILAVLAPLGPCRASAGGAVVYLHSAQPLEAVGAVLLAHHLTGAVVRGAEAGRRLGVQPSPAFADRVRATLDPDGRFR
ncbi:MAG: FAD-binding protein [Acidobacteria bacterium]|nr:FAD-binding protein [Acidobacteriota bacterium]